MLKKNYFVLNMLCCLICMILDIKLTYVSVKLIYHVANAV